MKKSIAVILSVCILFAALPLVSSAAQTDPISVLTARNIATMFAAVWEFTDENGDSYRFGADFELSHAQELTEADGSSSALLFEIHATDASAQKGYIVISLDATVPYLSQIGLGDAPAAETILLSAPDVQTVEEANENQKNNVNLLAALEEMKTMSLADRFQWLFDQIVYRLRYYLGDIWYGFEFDAESANRAVEETIREFAAANGSVVTKSWTVDKTFCVPHRQSYFFQSEEYYDGICGIAAWEMLLAYYRDGCGYTNLPDDHTMYKELMVIMDDLTERVLGGLDFLNDLNDIVTKYTDYYIPHNIRAHEIIGTLDAGIAMYLYQKGYPEAAANVLQNLSINIPLLTSAKRIALFSDLQAQLADWIYAETDGKISYLTGLANSAEDIIVRSLKRGEPVVIGNWFSLDEHSFTNHYFTAVGLYNIEGSIALSDSLSFDFNRQFIEVYDTWTDYGSAFIDLDNLMLKSMGNANSIADLAK